MVDQNCSFSCSIWQFLSRQKIPAARSFKTDGFTLTLDYLLYFLFAPRKCSIKRKKPISSYGNRPACSKQKLCYFFKVKMFFQHKKVSKVYQFCNSIASEASLHFGLKKVPKMVHSAIFWKFVVCGQTVLPYRSIQKEQKLAGNTKLKKFKLYIFGNFKQ